MADIDDDNVYSTVVELAANQDTKKDPEEKTREKVPGPLPVPKKPDLELGVSSNLPFSVPYKDGWEIYRDQEITVQQLLSMRHGDGQAEALFRLITLPIRSALRTSTVIPADGEEGGEEEAEFIDQMLKLPSSAGGMTTPFRKVMAQILLAVFDGFSPFELVYWMPKVGPLKGKWTLKKMAYRPPETITFVQDDDGDFAGLRQQIMHHGQSKDLFIPKEVAVYYAANEEESNFYGRSFFQAAFYHWDKKVRLYYIAHVAAQRAAVGTRVGEVPAGASLADKHAFSTALANMAAEQYIRVPVGFKVTSLSEAGNFNYVELINHHNNQMSKSVLAPFFDDSQGGGADNALVDFGKQSDALFLMMLETIMGDIAEMINNQVIPRFIDWNFGSGKYPSFQWGQLTAEQKAAAADTYDKIATSGQAYIGAPEFFHSLEKQRAEELGLEDLDWDSIDKAREEAQAKQAQMEEQQFGGGGFGGEEGAPAEEGFGDLEIPADLLPEGFL